MGIYRVTVKASYEADEAPDQARDELTTWARQEDDRTFATGQDGDLARWVATAVYRIQADIADEAELEARKHFADDFARAGITDPQRVETSARAE